MQHHVILRGHVVGTAHAIRKFVQGLFADACEAKFRETVCYSSLSK
jgi:hypothetical protein